MAWVLAPNSWTEDHVKITLKSSSNWLLPDRVTVEIHSTKEEIGTLVYLPPNIIGLAAGTRKD